MFGSILTNRFNEKSDVDMVVDFDKVNLEDYADNYFDFKYSLEDIFGREVDLLEDKAIRNPILRRNIDNSKLLVYGWIRHIPALKKDVKNILANK